MKKFYLLFLAVLFAFASGQATKVEIHTDIFGNQSWESVELPETNGSYVLTKEVKTNGQFGIKIDGTWYAAPNSGPVEISLDTPFKVQNGDHQNAEFNLGAGEYTFTFSLDAKELTVSKAGSPVEDVYTFYFRNDDNWSPVAFYTYNTEACGEWPGKQLTETVTGADGKTYYKVTVKKQAYDGIIFNNNNNGSQTDNITGDDIKDGGVYAPSGYVCLFSELQGGDQPSGHKATKLYFLHNFGSGWNETDAPAMTETAPGSGVFTYTLDVEANDGHYFSFTETQGGWHNETRYGPSTGGSEAKVNETTTDIVYGQDRSWNFKQGGKLTFTIDTNEAHRSLTISEGNTVYFRNTKGWEHIYLTTYDEASDMYGTNYKWTPEMFQQYQDYTTYGDRNTGVEITDNPTVSINGEEWIKVVLPADAKHFVFHNGQNPGKENETKTPVLEPQPNGKYFIADDAVAAWPESLYVFGHLDGWTFLPNLGVQLFEATPGSGIYSGVINVTSQAEGDGNSESDDTYGYISFTSRVLEGDNITKEDFKYINAWRFGPEAINTPIDTKEVRPFVMWNTWESSFKLKKGSYLVEVDFNTGTVMLDPERGQQIVEELPDALYIHGNLYRELSDGSVESHDWEWSSYEKAVAVKDETDENTRIYMFGNLRFADNGSGKGHFVVSSWASEVPLADEPQGAPRRRVSYAEQQNVFTPAGEVEDFARLTNGGNAYKFDVDNPEWHESLYAHRAGDAVETTDIVHEAVPGDYYAVTVKLTKGGENLRKVGMITHQSEEFDMTGVEGIATDASADAPVEFFTLQGVRVLNPEGGIFIRRQGNQVSKVAL